MGSEAAHFVWGDLKVFYWSPPLMARANIQPGNVASKPSPKLSLPKKAQVKCCECFSMFPQGLFFAAKLLMFPGWGTALVEPNDINFGQIIYLSPAACPGLNFKRSLLPRRAVPFLPLSAHAACPPSGHRLAILSLQMPSPPSSSPARPPAPCRAVPCAAERGVHSRGPAPTLPGCCRCPALLQATVKAAVLQLYLHPLFSILPGSTSCLLDLGAFLALGRQGSRQACRS